MMLVMMLAVVVAMTSNTCLLNMPFNMLTYHDDDIDGDDVGGGGDGGGGDNGGDDDGDDGEHDD